MAEPTFQVGMLPITRRRMLQGTAGLGIAMMLEQSGIGISAALTHSVSLDLGGNMWSLREEDTANSIRASVPGSNYAALLAVGKIPDPYFGDNNDKVQWVGERHSIFERTFDAPAHLHNKKHVELVCHGLDTLATIWLNGERIGESNNMFRKWSFDIRHHLRRGDNHLRIAFEPLTAYVQKQRAEYRQKYGIDLENERSWVRKAPYMWGWDWCRPVLTQGIWRKIEVHGYDARISDVGVRQYHQPNGTVQLEIHTRVAGCTAGASLAIQAELAGEVAGSTQGSAEDETTFHVSIPNPQLWWPNGVGDQPLYVVTVHLKDAGGLILDTAIQRIGLRIVEVAPPSQEMAMHLRVNGVAVFAKGADWIPADNMPERVTPEILRWYMFTAADAGFNFIRLWGGGYYEEDELFDLCDELGLMLQFEFKFANASYPIRDESWLENLRVEIEEQTRRCRNHASIVIWSGNNEIEYFDGYNQLFGDLIGSIVRRLVPDAFYEVGSGAHGSGDIHFWGVWHGNEPVESFLRIDGFVTEFGMQAPPLPSTVRAFTTPTDREEISSAVMRYHELDGSGHGIDIITRYTEGNFGRVPTNFDDKVWLTNLNQAWMIRYGVEHWRRDMPRSMAAVIWQYNDCWPCVSWSMVDYFRRSKPLLFQSRHFFAPVIVSGISHAETGQVEIYVTSDRQTKVTGELCWSVTDMDGKQLRQGKKQIDIPARSSWLAEQIELFDLVQANGTDNLLVWPEVVVDGRTIAQNTMFFGRPKQLKLTRPDLQVNVRGGETRYWIVIETDVPALWAWVELARDDASYSDNFFDLRQEKSVEIEVVLTSPMNPSDFRSQLRVRSVYDVAPAMRRQSSG